MEDLASRIMQLFADNPLGAYTNSDIAALFQEISERVVRRTTQKLTEAGKISISGRRGSANLYKMPLKVLYNHQKSYHEGYEAGLKASNLEAFKEGKRSALRALAKKLNINIHG